MLRKRISCAPCSHLLKINFFVAACEAFLMVTYAKYAAHRASCLSQKIAQSLTTFCRGYFKPPLQKGGLGDR